MLWFCCISPKFWGAPLYYDHVADINWD